MLPAAKSRSALRASISARTASDACHGTLCSSEFDQSSKVQSPSGRPAQYAATAGCWLHQLVSRSLPMTSIAAVRRVAAAASLVSTASRSSSPFLPFFEPLAIKTKRPPLPRVPVGIGLMTSSLSRAGSPADPALNCQHVSAEPSQSSTFAGFADQPSHPSSFALPSVLTQISLSGDPHLYACALSSCLMSTFRSSSPIVAMRSGDTWSATRKIEGRGVLMAYGVLSSLSQVGGICAFA